MEQVHTLMPVIILLLVGICAITVMRRIGLSPIVGYLVAGVLIGPHGFGIIHETKTTHLLAELGVVFLLFDIGLHFSLTRIWQARRDILGLGPLQIILCGLVFGGVSILFGLSAEGAVILGGALALSSTAVVTQSLAEKAQQNCPIGLTGTAVLIFQDICAIFLLILASSFEQKGSSSVQNLSLLAETSLAGIKAVLAFLAAVLIGRYAIKPLFHILSKTKNEEIFTITALLIVLATASATGFAGLSLTLGAFLGGMIISGAPHRHIIQTEAKPFRNLLLGFFFITVGMSLDWHILIGHWRGILIFLFILIIIKALLIGIAAKIFGWSTAGSIQLGFLLAQGSEFVFVIVAMPAIRELLGENLVGIIVAGIAVSLMVTPGLVSLGNHLAGVYRLKFNKPAAAESITVSSAIAPVVVFGMNDIGRIVADALEEHEISYDAIDMDYECFLAASNDGYPVAFGDPSDPRLMETLTYSAREALVVTIPRQDVMRKLKSIMSDRYPNLIRFIAVKTKDDHHYFSSYGTIPVINRSIPYGLDLATAVLRHMHVDEEKICIWSYRQQESALKDSALGLVQVD